MRPETIWQARATRDWIRDTVRYAWSIADDVAVAGYLRQRPALAQQAAGIVAFDRMLARLGEVRR